ncbi:MAG: hypothetical protein ACE5I9_07200 [Candidatus Methylomirabilales bacterium]
MIGDQVYRASGMALLAVLLLCGCASAPKPEAASPIQGPGDIPVPPGFQKIEEESVLIAFGGFQAGLGVYQGKREPSWVVEFYRGVLPSQGWTLVASFISRDSILLFTKERQACVVSVSGSGSSTHLEVRVGIAEPPAERSSPTPQPSPPSPAPPR